MKSSKVVFLVFLCLLSLCVVSVQPVESQSFEPIYIKPDGSVVGTDRIQRNGSLYTLTGNISGGIRVEKSYIVIDGAGHTIRGNGTGWGIDLSAMYNYGQTIFVSNVTVVNLRILNFYDGMYVKSTANNTFIGNYIGGCEGGFRIWSSNNNVLTHNTVEDCGISIYYSSGGNVITENNIINNTVVPWLSPEPVVDRNYWSSYNGTDQDGDGVGDTPYLYIDTDYARFWDNHPLMKPVNISDWAEDTTEIEPFPTTWVIAAVAAIAIAGVVFMVYFRKIKKPNVETEKPLSEAGT